MDILKNTGGKGSGRWRIALLICSQVLLILVATLVWWMNASPAMSLAKAAARGDLEEVRKTVDRNPELVNSYPDGSTPLHYAAANGHLAVVKFLVSRGADPTRPNEQGLTPAQWARQEHHETVAGFLDPSH
jgi:ankyrin repeat protein